MVSLHFHQCPTEVLQGYVANGISSREFERICSDTEPAHMGTGTRIWLAMLPQAQAFWMDICWKHFWDNVSQWSNCLIELNRCPVRACSNRTFDIGGMILFRKLCGTRYSIVIFLKMNVSF